MFLITVCALMAIGAVWALSNWRYAVIWAITMMCLISVQGYMTFVVLDYMNVPAAATSL